MTRRRLNRKPNHRGGVATAELVVCLPVLVLLVFGSIEASSLIFLRQSINVAAYEGIRETVRAGSDGANGIARAENILNARNVEGFQIAFPEGDGSDSERGELVAITVSANSNVNSPLAGSFIPNRLVTTRVVMVKE